MCVRCRLFACCMVFSFLCGCVGIPSPLVTPTPFPFPSQTVDSTSTVQPKWTVESSPTPETQCEPNSYAHVQARTALYRDQALREVVVILDAETVVLLTSDISAVSRYVVTAPGYVEVEGWIALWDLPPECATPIPVVE